MLFFASVFASVAAAMSVRSLRMKTIGLIGGMSWESTRLYYDAINRDVVARLGGLHSARLVLHSVDFAPMAAHLAAGEWDALGEILAKAAQGLERAGADCIALATNTMHNVADKVIPATKLPFVHVGEVTSQALAAAGKSRPLLLATRFTMEQAFYKDILTRHGLQVTVPSKPERDEVHRIVFEELCRGVTKPTSRAMYEGEAIKAKQAGCDCVILGCTEIGMLLSDANAALPTFDTMVLHSRALVDFALG
jgi:aspartate racemase